MGADLRARPPTRHPGLTPGVAPDVAPGLTPDAGQAGDQAGQLHVVSVVFSPDGCGLCFAQLDESSHTKLHDRLGLRKALGRSAARTQALAGRLQVTPEIRAHRPGDYLCGRRYFTPDRARLSLCRASTRHAWRVPLPVADRGTAGCVQRHARRLSIPVHREADDRRTPFRDRARSKARRCAPGGRCSHRRRPPSTGDP